ncbi:Acyl-coenzyme A thioesterase THEM4 [Hondaea fermentalgiana]|uniref:Acyl-coenzyme A thioesterase THEM4 n=1 Tax=Hondaea fermentalgiana TaxID=2315210 RepID=A0A2R5GET1_9STRA|nr:Acyl-coenzyme A thioesterase THEM4 [Hondaea fermentalgiana]|eukprot:GBG28819.1 Acyl-coenzyme A thioesterase THEM4 [Hondaea fermentalgiana]
MLAADPTFKEAKFPEIGNEHFVLGDRSAFRFRFAASQEKHQVVCAVYAGTYSTNTAGMMHGGAVSTVFDMVVALSGSAVLQSPGAYGMTKRLEIAYLRPSPLKKCVRVESDFNYTPGDKDAQVTAKMVDVETATVTARATATMSDFYRRSTAKL